MKKIITLLFSFGAVTAVFAQNTRDMENSKRVILGAPRTSKPSQNPKEVVLGNDGRVYEGNGTSYPQTYPYPKGSSSRDAQINNINREYDAKIQSIRNNRYLSYEEKERMIRQLEADRARAIRQVNNQYGNKRNNDRDHDDDDDHEYNHKRNKGNNGNHYGWEKGKGNPHKGRD